MVNKFLERHLHVYTWEKQEKLIRRSILENNVIIIPIALPLKGLPSNTYEPTTPKDGLFRDDGVPVADATLQENVKQIKLSQEQVVEGFKVYIKQKVD